MSYKILYSFGAHPNDAIEPSTALTDANGLLYGTTAYGGLYNAGTVFKVSTTGKERVIHSFGSGGDGVRPEASLIEVNGTLYGTTQWGGAGSCRSTSGIKGCGTVYSITTRGQENVLYSFADTPDGAHPVAGLLDVDGTLYGTTANGGTSGLGTVFGVSTSGAETVLHSFAGGNHDGAYPVAALTKVHGILYGTTRDGGNRRSGGTAFSITTSGSERLLYSFGKDNDAISPRAGLLAVKTLYGTSITGGQYVSGGTVFAIDKHNKERVLHSFGFGDDGSQPAASLIDMNDSLYGTTIGGGDYRVGTVFGISTSGDEYVLHSFVGSDGDGKWPSASLIDVNGTLYGTTSEGGPYGTKYTHGFGTVFALRP